MPEPWDRLPDEPNRWYARFETYRRLGSSRSISAAYTAHRAEERLSRAAPGGYWYEMARRWRWHERAEAWDEHVRKRFQEKEEQRIEEAQHARIDMIQAVLDLSFDRLLPLLQLPESTDLPALRLLFRDMLNEQRKELPAGAPSSSEVVTITADDLLAAQRKLDSWQEAVRSAHDANWLLALRACLLNLYPDTSSARRVADQAGLDRDRIGFSDRSVDTWHAILAEAERNNQIERLIEVAESEYPNNPELLACMKTQPKRSQPRRTRPPGPRPQNAATDTSEE